MFDHLHWNGAHDVLTDDELWQVYCLGDGFGRQTSAALHEINDGWDWSHVRDSSPEAVTEMATLIREILDRRAGIEIAERHTRNLRAQRDQQLREAMRP